MQQRHALRRPRLVTGLLLAAVVPLAACGNDSAGPEVGVAASDVADNTQIGADPFLGNTVTVSGKVTSVIGPTAFRIAGDDWGGEPLRVVNAAKTSFNEGDLVRVTGVVRQFEETALEKDYGLALDGPWVGDWSNDQVVVAKQVVMNPNT